VLTPSRRGEDWLSAAELASLSPDVVIERLEGLRGLIGSKARDVETNRRVDDEVWSAIRTTGLFYLFVPQKYGGLEAGGLKAFIDAISLIGEECGSTAWCASFALAHQWYLAQFPQQAQEEIWSNTPYFVSAGSAFPPGKLTRVDRGYRLSGRWKWGSGVMNSDWLQSLAILEGEDGTKTPYFVLVPTEEATVIDTWFMDGLSGTGSHDYVIDDVFVPEHLALPFDVLLNGQPDHENPFYRMPLTGISVLETAAPVLGIARGAVKRFQHKLSHGGDGVRAATGGKPVDNPLMHAALGRADMLVTTAELTMHAAAAEMGALTPGDDHVPLVDRVRNRTMIAHAAQQCLEAVRVINDNGGSTAHQLANPAQRSLRDVTVIATHLTLDSTEAPQLWGRIMSGLPSNNLLFK
jgi:alkylation response protein AidB-like acyl-CoA dehydrogenase